MAKAKSKNPPAAAVQAAPVVANLPEGVKAVRNVTLPTLVLKKAGDSAVLKFMDAMRVSKVKTKPDIGPDGKVKEREPATVATVVNTQTGEQFIYLVASVVKSNLERDYPDETYVGKSFYIQNKGKRTENQRYNDFAIIEVEAA